MNVYLLPGMMGLLLGLLLHWIGLHRPHALRDGLALRPSIALRAGLTALGWSILLTALLIWLAVLDVDRIPIVPLTWGTLLGGGLLGLCAGLTGFTPMTAFAGLAGPHPLEALCTLAGCFLGGIFLPPIQTAILTNASFDGRWIALGMIVTAMFIRTPRPKALPAAPEDTPSPPEPEAAEEATAPETESPPDPESAPEETVIALLPEEEPLIVDTALDEEAEESPNDE